MYKNNNPIILIMQAIFLRIPHTETPKPKSLLVKKKADMPG
jgi:hypothetical protein